MTADPQTPLDMARGQQHEPEAASEASLNLEDASDHIWEILQDSPAVGSASTDNKICRYKECGRDYTVY